MKRDDSMKKLLIISTFSLLIWGCKGDTSPAGPILSGNIVGSVNLVKQTNTDDYSGVTIMISSDTYIDSTTSLSDGTWRLANIPAGIYDFTFSKSGFFTEKEFNFQFVGSGTYYFYQERLEYVSSSSVTGLSIVPIDSIQSIHIEGIITPNDPLSRYVYVFFSRSPFPNSVPIEFPEMIYIPTNGESKISGYYEYDYLTEEAKEGDTLYAMAVLGGFGDSGINYNPATKMNEFDTPGITRSNIVKFVVP